MFSHNGANGPESDSLLGGDNSQTLDDVVRLSSMGGGTSGKVYHLRLHLAECCCCSYFLSSMLLFYYPRASEGICFHRCWNVCLCVCLWPL